MSNSAFDSGRRDWLRALAALGLTAAVPTGAWSETQEKLLRFAIPRSGEEIPAIGMGTWLTFSVPPFTQARKDRVEVLRRFFELGGGLVDSSPMYGLSESTLGHCLEEVGGEPPLFAATKVWVPTRIAGVAQIGASRSQWGIGRFDLLQIHNMLDWDAHLPTLQGMKQEKRIRYIGITTSHGRRHRDFERVVREQDAFDFVQFSYNIADREAEKRLLPMAADEGRAVIINRPFRTGALFDRVRGRALPEWAGEIGCENWAQFFLKFVISHPAVTCAIPATRRVDHMVENMGALRGPLPDAAMRQRMVKFFEA